MVKSKKNPSRIWVHFPIFLKLNVQSIILSKFLQHEIENCYEAWAQKQSAKLQNMRVCTDKTGLSSITTCLTHLKSWMIGRSNDLEDVGRVASSFPTYLGKIEERLYWKCTVVVLQPGLTFVLYFRLWNPKYSSRNPESH